MKCPICGSNLIVADSRKSTDYVVRERWCSKCRKTYYSLEEFIHREEALKLKRDIKHEKGAQHVLV